MEIVHIDSGIVIASNVKYANTFYTRLKGLMFISEMNNMDALLIEPCNSIHNCFVRFPLDVVFLDKNNHIVKIIRNFKPWRFSWIYFKATKTLELKAGDLIDEVKVGDEVEVRGV